MRKLGISLIIFMLVSVFVKAQSKGELSVSVSTSETGGNYAPRNIMAIWIEDDAGNFVKTLLAYADKRKSHLNTWQASTNDAGSEFNTVDAITGATKSSHSTRICSWDGSDILGNLVADGTYKVWMELTDKNSTGNFTSFAFKKGQNADVQSPDDAPSFSSISITWRPEVASTINQNDKVIPKVYPNPGSGIFKIEGSEIVSVEVYNTTGLLVFKSDKNFVDIRGCNSGIYFFVLKTPQNTELIKVVKE